MKQIFFCDSRKRRHVRKSLFVIQTVEGGCQSQRGVIKPSVELRSGGDGDKHTEPLCIHWHSSGKDGM